MWPALNRISGFCYFRLFPIFLTTNLKCTVSMETQNDQSKFIRIFTQFRIVFQCQVFTPHLCIVCTSKFDLRSPSGHMGWPHPPHGHVVAPVSSARHVSRHEGCEQCVGDAASPCSQGARSGEREGEERRGRGREGVGK